MKRPLIIVLALAFTATLPATALAATTPWSGTTGTPGSEPISGIPFQTLLLHSSGGKVKAKRLQAVMRCTDQTDGTVNPVAYSVSSSTRATLRRNRFSLSFTASSGGRSGVVHLTGLLRSNGTGTARLTLTATSRDTSTGAIIERCSTTVNWQIRRGRAF